MKNIAILASDMKDILNPSIYFVLDLIEEMYRNDIKVTVFAKSFSANFPSHVVRKKINVSENNFSLKAAAKKIAKELTTVEFIIALDFPMNILASMVKNRIMEYRGSDYPIRIVWYVFSFHLDVYKKKRSFIFDDVLVKLDMEHTANIDFIKTSSKKIEENIRYIHKDIKNIETIYPSYRKMKISGEDDKKYEYNYFLLFAKNDFDRALKCIIAYSIFIKDSKNIKYRLKIIGYNNSIKQQIDILKIHEHIDLVSESDYAENEMFIKDAYSVIIHDINQDFNSAIFSAWYSKTLVIIDKNSTVSELATNKENALVVDTDNPLALSHTFSIATINKDLYQNITDNAYEYISSKFASTKYKNDLINNLLDIK